MGVIIKDPDLISISDEDMRVTQLFGKTLRQDPAEAETAAHRLMLKAGLISQLASGLYSYLPVAWRSLRKIEEIIRREMDAAGGQELKMSALQPMELWQETGRESAFGQNLFRLVDRRERLLVLGPTHEEVITKLVKSNVQSYRDLPILLYQIQTKFRDELRPRGGLMRVREFDMKDAYSFDVDADGLDKTYRRMSQVYRNIFTSCGLPAMAVEADSGAIGGKDSQEFILPAPSGEDTIVSCSSCGYAANVERARILKAKVHEELPKALEEIHTPGIRTIQELAGYLSIPHSKTLKAVFYMADGEMVFVTIRGDLEVNDVKLKNILRCSELRLASKEDVKMAALVTGFASPIGLGSIYIVADDSIQDGNNFVLGANKIDYHFINANYPRDFKVDVVADIALASEDNLCYQCGKPLVTTRGIEVGHVFKLGTFFTEKLGASYLDSQGNSYPLMMGCYGIGIGRLLAAAIEQNHDGKGIIFPEAIAPFQVHILPLNMDDVDVVEQSKAIYDKLKMSGVDVLLDDRIESPGVKFNDADLLGLPFRLVLSKRSLREQSAEIKRRGELDGRLIPVEGILQWLTEQLSG